LNIDTGKHKTWVVGSHEWILVWVWFSWTECKDTLSLSVEHESSVLSFGSSQFSEIGCGLTNGFGDILELNFATLFVLKNVVAHILIVRLKLLWEIKCFVSHGFSNHYLRDLIIEVGR
jgi:hypothetical protein